MPIPKAQVVNLSEAERQGLEKLIKRHQVGQQIALRARIVLAAAGGRKNKDIALEDLSLEDRLAEAPRPGAPAQITADQRCRIEALACETPEESGRPITHWTAREIADELKKRKIVENISPRHAARLLKRG
jgi:putative transposase